jgi:FixJ family two-component response regulator
MWATVVRTALRRIRVRGVHMRFAQTIVHLVRNDLAGTKKLTQFFTSMGVNVALFKTAAEYIAARRDERPSCLILDLALPDVHGLEIQAKLAGSGAPPIIFVTAHGDPVSVARAMKNGAIDFLIEPVDYMQLIAAVEFAFTQDLKNRIDRIESTALLARWKSLTPREREVFHHTVAGLLNKQAAAELGVAENTYQVHRGRVMRKMKADSLADLVRMSAKLEPFVQKPSQENPAIPRPRWTLEEPTTIESTRADAYRLSATGRSRSTSAWAEL